MADRPWEDPRPWDRLPDESEVAHAQFRTFLEAGAERSVSDTARKVGRSERQLHKQASRHRWRDRARAYDIAQARAEEEGEQERRQARQRRLEEHVEWAERVALARLRRVVQEDPVTGELAFEGSFGVREALAVLRGTRHLRPGEMPDDKDPLDPEGRLRRLSTRELEDLCTFITEQTEEDNDVETPTPPEQESPAEGGPAGGGQTPD
jgi:hypothetical protein